MNLTLSATLTDTCGACVRRMREEAMTPAFQIAKLAGAFGVCACCPHCGDLMIAPVCSEFVAGGEIRHHWDCEACGESSCTTIDLHDARPSLLREPAE